MILLALSAFAWLIAAVVLSLVVGAVIDRYDLDPFDVDE